MTSKEWRERVGVRIKERRQEVGFRSMRKAAAAAGFSESVWRQLESGVRQIAPGHTQAPNPTQDTKVAACRVLGWTGDSIDRLLAGERPILRSPEQAEPAMADDLSRVWSVLTMQLYETREEMEELAAAVDTIADYLYDVESTLDSALEDPPGGFSIAEYKPTIDALLKRRRARALRDAGLESGPGRSFVPPLVAVAAGELIDDVEGWAEAAATGEQNLDEGEDRAPHAPAEQQDA